MRIEILTIADCPHEHAAGALLATALAELGVRAATVVRTTIETDEAAQASMFVGSPTFRVDGRDLFPVDAAPVGLACRVYLTPDGPRGVPTLPDLRRALAAAAAR